jgi:murein L,D-transpeptidase YcbB/YkuD
MHSTGSWRIAFAAIALWAFAVQPSAQAQAPAGVERPASTGALRPGQAESLWRMMASAELEGLSPNDYVDRALEAQLGAPDPRRRQAGEASLVEAAVRFAQHVRSGRTPAGGFRSDWAIRPTAYDAHTDLVAALGEGRLEAWRSNLAPPHPQYRLLQTELARYRQIVDQGGWKSLDVRRSLKIGVEHEAVAALRERLAAEGAELALTDAPRVFDPDLQRAVARFQASHGLTPSGEADRATLQALNVPASTRVASIVANLERWRWLPRVLPDTRVEVNIAAAGLQVFETARPVLSMRTVVGRPADPSPMFADAIEAVVFNPPWNVPQGIAEREILPKARTDPGYLAREGFVWVQDGAGRRLQQKAGPKSALGRYKFDLPNRFSVYLHDTPVRSVFDRDRRALSHGCIRLQEPRALALWALGRQDGWDEAAIDRAVATGTTSSVRLARPVPVYLLYWTAFVSEDGELNFRDDIYGWDRLRAAD